MRNTLIQVYMDFVNNYLTVDLFAEHNGLTVDQARTLLELARNVENSDHPES